MPFQKKLMDKKISLVLMAAGLSSRFGGKIKQFAIVGPNKETLVEYTLNQSLSQEINKIIFIVGYNTEQIFKEKFKDSYSNLKVEYAKQTFNDKERDKPWGTVDALCSALPNIDDACIVINGDDIYGKTTYLQLIEHLKKSNDDATIGYKLKKVLPDKGKVNRGIFQTDPDNNVTSIKEYFDIEKDNIEKSGLSKEEECSMNIFALHKKTVELLSENLNKFKKEHKKDKKSECLLPVELSNLIQESKIKMKLYPTNEQWLGVTNPEDEEKVKNILEKI
jgi:NDP-sugar pyrophosphorylase family protein